MAAVTVLLRGRGGRVDRALPPCPESVADSLHIFSVFRLLLATIRSSSSSQARMVVEGARRREVGDAISDEMARAIGVVAGRTVSREYAVYVVCGDASDGAARRFDEARPLGRLSSACRFARDEAPGRSKKEKSSQEGTLGIGGGVSGSALLLPDVEGAGDVLRELAADFARAARFLAILVVTTSRCS